jgi:hypothetical protein
MKVIVPHDEISMIDHSAVSRITDLDGRRPPARSITRYGRQPWLKLLLLSLVGVFVGALVGVFCR